MVSFKVKFWSVNYSLLLEAKSLSHPLFIHTLCTNSCYLRNSFPFNFELPVHVVVVSLGLVLVAFSAISSARLKE